MAQKKPVDAEKDAVRSEVYERDVLPYALAIKKLHHDGVSFKDMANAPGSYVAAKTLQNLAGKPGTRSPAPYTLEAARAALRRYDSRALSAIQKEYRHAMFDIMSVEEQAAVIAELQARQKRS